MPRLPCLIVPAHLAAGLAACAAVSWSSDAVRCSSRRAQHPTAAPSLAAGAGAAGQQAAHRRQQEGQCGRQCVQDPRPAQGLGRCRCHLWRRWCGSGGCDETAQALHHLDAVEPGPGAHQHCLSWFGRPNRPSVACAARRACRLPTLTLGHACQLPTLTLGRACRLPTLTLGRACLLGALA
jgi:hypothetical protein